MEEHEDTADVTPIKCRKNGRFIEWFENCKKAFDDKNGTSISNPDMCEVIASRFKGQFVP